MNPTEIADALHTLAQEPFDPVGFGLAFAEATDNPQATLAKLRNGTANKSDVPGGMLLARKFHYAPAATGDLEAVLEQLRASKKNKTGKPAILLATDGQNIAAEHPKSGDKLHCDFSELGAKFAFFLPAAGKERYRAAEENPIDVRATGKLEELLHRFFAAARPAELFIVDRFGKRVNPREWFYVLPEHVGQAANLLKEQRLHLYRYDPATQRIVER